MINQIVDGISIKLNQVFGDGVRVYAESIKQGFQEPCFFIAVLNSDQSSMLMHRSLRRQSFDIHYFPVEAESNREIQDAASSLYVTLDEIELLNGDRLLGAKMNHETVDGVLHFFVNYDMFVNKIVTPEDGMEEIAHITDVKG